LPLLLLRVAAHRDVDAGVLLVGDDVVSAVVVELTDDLIGCSRVVDAGDTADVVLHCLVVPP
jgi:predicted dinucleotide-binding enzyme